MCRRLYTSPERSDGRMIGTTIYKNRQTQKAFFGTRADELLHENSDPTAAHHIYMNDCSEYNRDMTATYTWFGPAIGL
jgi:hypothetical protein